MTAEKKPNRPRRRPSGPTPRRRPQPARRPGGGTPLPRERSREVRVRSPRLSGLALTPTGTPVDSIGGVPLPRRRGEPPATLVEVPLEREPPPVASAERVAAPELVANPRDLRPVFAVLVAVAALAAAFAPSWLESDARARMIGLHDAVAGEAQRIGEQNEQLPVWIATRDVDSLRSLQTLEQAEVADRLGQAGYDVDRDQVAMRVNYAEQGLTLRVEVPAQQTWVIATTEGELRGPAPEPAGLGAVLSERAGTVASTLLLGLFLAGLPWAYPRLRARLS